MFKNFLLKSLKVLCFAFVAIIIILLSLGIIFYLSGPNNNNPDWGINFATGQSKYLGFEPTVLMSKILTDLNPKYIRLTAYWEEIEANPGQYDFSTTDNLLNLTDDSSTKVLLVIGHKQPRWPECHHPEWYENLSSEEQAASLEKFITESVSHFKNRNSIWAWQLENEPFFDFGKDCPVSEFSDYRSKIKLIKSLDDRPVVITDSGEKSTWLPAAWAGADIFGSTMYRQVYHGEKQKYITYPLPGWSYRLKSGMIKLLSPTNTSIGVELQAEPWFNRDPNDTSLQDQFTLMNPEILNTNIAYAKQSGFSQHYFWGVEWWYWLEAQHNNSNMLNMAKEFFNSN